MNRAGTARAAHAPSFPRLVAYRVVPQPCNLDGISMNIQEENSALYFRVQSEREQTLVMQYHLIVNRDFPIVVVHFPLVFLLICKSGEVYSYS